MTRIGLCLLLALGTFAAAPPAKAAFPGTNGKIVFEDDGVLKTIAPAGTDLVEIPGTADAQHPAVSPDGTRIAIDGVRTFDFSGADSKQLSTGVKPAWSPDGRQIVYQNGLDLFVMNADGSGTPQPLTSGADVDDAPAWSPRNDLIAFVSARSGDRQVWVIKPDGSGARQLSAVGSVSSERPSWSPDGSKVVYSIDDGTIVDLYVTPAAAVPATSPDDTRITVNGSSAVFNDSPAWSPDGTQIAFSSNRTGAREIWAVGAGGGGDRQITTSGGRGPDWQAIPVACPDVPVGFATARGCFTETAPGSGVFETDQKAWVGGFEIQPRPGGKLVLDANNPGVSEGGAGADIVFRGRALPFPVSALPVGLTGASIPFGQPGTLGFLFDVPVKGSVAVAWAENGTASSFEAEIEINELTRGIGAPDPSTLGSGKLKAKLVNGTGFKLEDFEVKIDEISVTPARMIVPRQLKLKNLLLKMELRPDAAMVEQPFWTGQAGITLPLTRGDLDVTGRAFVFAGGLAGGALEVDGLNVAIPNTPLFLQKVGGDLLFQPRFGFTLLIGGSLGPRVRGKLLMDIDGTMQGGELVGGCSAGSDPSKLEFTAKLTPLALLEANALAKADLTFRSCLYTGAVPAMELTGEAKIAFLGGLLGYEGSQTGFISTRGANLEGAVKLRIPSLPDLDGKAIVSTKGIGACADLTFFKGGFGYIYGASQPPGTFSGCDLAPFRVTASAASLRAHTARATRVPAGLPHAAFAAKSRRGAPRVKVTGPGGFKVTSPRGGRALRSRRVVIVPVKHEKTTYVIVNDPRAGSWKVESVERRKPLTRVGFARGLAKPKVRAKLTKRGKRLVLNYTLRAMPGQRIVFIERSRAGVEKPIGSARRRKGKLTFTPTRGTPRKRTIQAEVTQNNLPRALITVARFKAPG